MEKISSQEAAVNLEEERIPIDFSTATLELNGTTANLDLENDVTEPRVGFKEPSVKRPLTAELTREQLHMNKTDAMARQYFVNRPGLLENAMTDISKHVKQDIDGTILGAWVLTEIDHWDNNHERVVLVCDGSLIVVRYDFVATKFLDFRRILLHMIDTINTGDMVYPEKSFMIQRQHSGMRISWGQTQPLTFAQKWNPWCTDIPYTTFSNHPLFYLAGGQGRYSVEDMQSTLSAAVRRSYQSRAQDSSLLTIEQGSIMIESFASVSSMVFNQSHLGYSKERGGISF